MIKTEGKVKILRPTEEAYWESEKDAHNRWRVHDGVNRFRLSFIKKDDAYEYALKYGLPCIGFAQWNEELQQNEYFYVTVIKG